MLTAWALLRPTLTAAAAPILYGTGPRVTDDAGVPSHANGQRVVHARSSTGTCCTSGSPTR